MAPFRRGSRSSNDNQGTPGSNSGRRKSSGKGKPSHYQPELPFEDGPAPGTSVAANELSHMLTSYRYHLMELLSDVIAQHEIAQERSSGAHAMAPGRAQAVLAAISLDHVVLPRWALEDLLESYALNKDKYPGLHEDLEALNTLYRAATGWTS